MLCLCLCLCFMHNRNSYSRCGLFFFSALLDCVLLLSISFYLSMLPFAHYLHLMSISPSTCDQDTASRWTTTKHCARLAWWCWSCFQISRNGTLAKTKWQTLCYWKARKRHKWNNGQNEQTNTRTTVFLLLLKEFWLKFFNKWVSIDNYINFHILIQCHDWYPLWITNVFVCVFSFRRSFSHHISIKRTFLSLSR